MTMVSILTWSSVTVYFGIEASVPEIIMEKCSNINRQMSQKKKWTWTYKCHVYMQDCHLLNGLPHCTTRCAVRTYNYPPFEWSWCTTLTKLNVQVIFVTSTMNIKAMTQINKVHGLYMSSYMTRVITWNRTELNIQLRTQKQETHSLTALHITTYFLIQWYKLETNKYNVYTEGDTPACLQSISYKFWPSKAIVMEFWSS
jgi:hypothetical protein